MTAAYITFSTGRRVAHWAGGGFAAPTVRKFSPIDGVLLHHGLPAWPPDLSGYSLAERHAGDIIDALRPAFAEGVESTVIFEPGRAITGSAQCLLLSVINRKDFGRQVPAIVLDGGRNIVMPPSWQSHALLPVNEVAMPGSGYFDVFGPLCHRGEMLFRTRGLPDSCPRLSLRSPLPYDRSVYAFRLP